MINLRLGALGLDSPEPLHQGLALLRNESREAAVALYQTMRKLVALQSIISSGPVQSAAIALLGTRHLISSAQSIRYDPPQGNELLIDWHQDYPFIQDSEDSLVFWFPLADLSPTSGGVRLLPGSHLNGIRTVRRVKNPHGSGHWLKQVEEINETDSVFPPSFHRLHKEPPSCSTFSCMMFPRRLFWYSSAPYAFGKSLLTQYRPSCFGRRSLFRKASALHAQRWLTLGRWH